MNYTKEQLIPTVRMTQNVVGTRRFRAGTGIPYANYICPTPRPRLSESYYCVYIAPNNRICALSQLEAQSTFTVYETL